MGKYKGSKGKSRFGGFFSRKKPSKKYPTQSGSNSKPYPTYNQVNNNKIPPAGTSGSFSSSKTSPWKNSNYKGSKTSSISAIGGAGYGSAKGFSSLPKGKGTFMGMSKTGLATTAVAAGTAYVGYKAGLKPAGSRPFFVVDFDVAYHLKFVAGVKYGG